MSLRIEQQCCSTEANEASIEMLRGLTMLASHGINGVDPSFFHLPFCQPLEDIRSTGLVHICHGWCLDLTDPCIVKIFHRIMSCCNEWWRGRRCNICPCGRVLSSGPENFRVLAWQETCAGAE